MTLLMPVAFLLATWAAPQQGSLEQALAAGDEERVTLAARNEPQQILLTFESLLRRATQTRGPSECCDLLDMAERLGRAMRIERGAPALEEYARRLKTMNADEWARHQEARRLMYEAQPLAQEFAVEKAAGLAKRARSIASDQGDPFVLCEALGMEGRYSMTQGRFEEALQLLQRGASLAESCGGEVQAVYFLDLAGECLKRLGCFSAAKEAHERALDGARRCGSSVDEVRALSRLGQLSYDQGRYREALRWIDEARSLDPSLPESQPLLSGSLAQMTAVILLSLGDLEGFERYLQRFVEDWSRLTHPFAKADVLVELGRLREMEGQWELAASLYGEAADLAAAGGNVSTEAESCRRAAEAFLLAGKASEAIEAFDEALALIEERGDLAEHLPILTGLGRAYLESGDLTAAETVFEDAAEILQGGFFPLYEVYVYWGLAGVALRTSDLVRAEEAVSRAEARLNLTLDPGLDAQARWAIASEYAEFTELANDVAALRLRRDEAADGDRARERFLREVESRRSLVLATISFSPPGSLPPELMERRAILLRALSSLHQSLPGASDDERTRMAAERERLAHELADILLRLRALRGASPSEVKSLESPDLARIRERLPVKGAFLELALGRSSVYSILITKERVQVQEQPSSPLRIAAKKLRQAVHSRESSLGAFKEVARDLFVKLLGVLDIDLEQVTHLVVSPDGFLWEVPFELLLTSPQGTRFDELSYLIRRVAVRYVPSATTAITGSSEPVPASSDAILVVGVPGGGSRAREAELRFACQEAKSVATLHAAAHEREAVAGLSENGELCGEQFDLLLGAAASPEAVVERLKERRHAIVHIASHAVNVAAAPDLSALILAEGAHGRELTFGEILDLDLSTKLVVLSACATQEGAFASREGPLALAYAVLLAGSRHVVASRFAVDDEATALLMLAFHERLRQGLLPEVAWREAQLEMLADTARSHPFYFGGFSDFARSMPEPRG
ncbi:MAG: CHAT domain-containing protein [Planctomycetota bacterium]